MFYCTKCGAQMADEAKFCRACGTPAQQPVPQQTAQPVSPAPAVQAVPAADTQAAVKKKSKLPLMIILCAVLLIGAGAAVYFLFFNKTPQEKALDRFFDACTELDCGKVIEACYPDPDAYDMPESDVFFFGNVLGFDRGVLGREILSNPMALTPGMRDMYFESYGFDDIEDYNDAINHNGHLDELYSDFKAEYELVKMKKADEVEVSLANYGSVGWLAGEQSVEADIKEDIEHATGEDVDEVYAAQIKIKWSCGDMEYGNDKSWWDDKDFIEKQESGFISDRSYKETIKEYEDRKYDVFVYKCKDEWYVFPINLIRNSYVVEW